MSRPVDGVLFVTGDLEYEHLVAYARRFAPDADIRQAKKIEDLAVGLDEMPLRTRMIAVATAVIVPSVILNRLHLTPYNFHPGSPEYPGRYPESFAVYDGVTHFGATAHVMLPRVDEGGIVGVERFDVVGQPDRMALADLAYQAMIRLFGNLAPHMVISGDPMPVFPDEKWSGIKRSRADFLAMQQIGNHMPDDEVARRIRAFGKQDPTVK